MSFTHPFYLVVAGVLAAIFGALALAARRRRSVDALRYSNLAFLVGAVQARAWPARALAGGWIAALLLVVIAAGGPRVRAAVPVRDGAAVLCVDTSGSMAAADVQPTRAAAALAAVRAFIADAPPGIAIGLVAFSSGAQAIVSPTRDRTALQNALPEIPAPNGGTAIGDALLLAGRILPQRGHRLIVLITDGENNAGTDPLHAAQALAAQHVRLYTIGIGTNSGALIPGTLQSAGIDEEALREYASVTGGTYSRAADATQLREALASLGRTTSFVRKNVDVSLAAALAGAALLALTYLAGIAAGRYP